MQGLGAEPETFLPDCGMPGLMPGPIPKPVRDSQVEMLELVLPQHTNPLGNVLGGHVMHLMDQAAAAAAVRHCRRPCVTAEVDKLDFRSPIKLGEFIILKASVNAAFHTSMEVGVRVESEHPLTGERRHTSSAYFTFVALDDLGKPTAVPALRPESPDEERRFHDALRRRGQRLKDAKRDARPARKR
jgi:acyl-CoA hydrolase